MKKLILLTTLIIQSVFAQMQAASIVTKQGDPIIGGQMIGGQMIGGAFVRATQGTPVGNANMFPGNGLPAFAIDGDSVNSKYRNFGELNTGFVVTPSFGGGQGGVGTFVTRLDIATASDAPERDPLTFTLEGTNGDPLTGIYTLIASGSTGLDNDPGRSTFVISQSFPGVGAFTSYRVIFPTVRNSATADSMQVSEVGLSGVRAPEPTAFTLLGLSAIGLFGSRRRY